MAILVEAIKNWRKSRETENGIEYTKAEWTLDDDLVCHPITENSVRKISSLIDKKLAEYSVQKGFSKPIGIDRWDDFKPKDEHISSDFKLKADIMLRPFNEYYTPMDYPNLDMPVSTNGSTYDTRHRTKDSFMRLKHSHIYNNVTVGKKSYVTFYEIDHINKRINADLVIADANIPLDENKWYRFTTPDDTLNNTVKRTIWENMNIGILKSNYIDEISEKEQVALETLREMVTEAEYRNYLKYCYLLVRGESGCTYQLFRDRSHTKVWKNGKFIEEVCVRLKDIKIPPTDNIIAFKVIIETSEEDFKKLGNVYKRVA